MKKILLNFFFCSSFWLFSQNYSVATLNDTLLKNANAVIRVNDLKYTIVAIDKMKISKKKVVTILKESANHFAFNYEMYSPKERINAIEVKIYDASGKEIKKIKRKEFTDESAINDFSLYGDNRVLYYEYKSLVYPYTVEFTSEVETENTLFISDFYGNKNIDYAVEKDVMTIENLSSINLRYKAYRNINNAIQESVEKEGNRIKKITVSQHNVKAIQEEPYMPSTTSIVPMYSFSLDEYMVEGEKGNISSWEEFGKWLYSLNKNTTILSEEAKKEIHALTDTLKSNKEKIQALYQFLQNKTRYISVQLGIGGLKPMLAQEVHNLGYGDCKALSNYMNTMLKEIGIESNYAIITAGNNKISFDSDFPKFGGNHAILYIPNDNEKNPIWLECTSQQTAFNYQGDFTGERNALIITENGGKLVQTQQYPAEVNNEILNLTIDLKTDATSQVSVENTFTGVQYDRHLSLPLKSVQEQKNILIKEYDGFSNGTFSNPIFNNDRNHAIFTEKFIISNVQIGKIASNNYLLSAIPTRKMESTLKTDFDRKFDVYVRFGVKDTYTITYVIPEDFQFDKLPENISIIDKDFGSYSLAFSHENNHIKITRIMLLNGGTFSNTKYNNFVQFYNKIAKADATKLLFQLNN